MKAIESVAIFNPSKLVSFPVFTYAFIERKAFKRENRFHIFVERDGMENLRVRATAVLRTIDEIDKLISL